jgi:phosphoribosylaminoimidazole-succinocarboxamide synthase
MGSVKDLEVLQQATPGSPGRARFIFSDRYSVFDWGEMPDRIPDKGAAIALLSAHFFEELERAGIRTHYVGLVEDGRTAPLGSIRRPVDAMEVRLLRVIEPPLREGRYDYSAYRHEHGNFLIPLEIIYRNALPAGSSVFKRLEAGELRPQDLGLDAMPVADQRLDRPIYDVSTKLEITDRYLTWQEAAEIAGLDEGEVAAVKEMAATVNRLITDTFLKIGLVNEDGKIEVGFDAERRLMVVDVLGTLDECRFTHQGMPVSKELARIHYRGTDWHRAVEAAKKVDRARWKEICGLGPEPLPPRLRAGIAQIYRACTNEITGRRWFPDVPPLGEILAEVREFL